MANADESKKATALTCGGPPPVVCTGVRVKISNLNVVLTSVKQNHFDEQSQKKKDNQRHGAFGSKSKAHKILEWNKQGFFSAVFTFAERQ